MALVENNLNKIQYITEEDVKTVLSESGLVNNGTKIINYKISNASNKMLGFLADYWRLEVLITSEGKKEVLSFFIKAVSRSNAAKAEMVKELKLYEKELAFYSIIKKAFEVPGLKPWSAGFIADLKDAMVFQDLNAMNYKLCNKFKRFDASHTMQALRTLSRFHASSIIYEIRRTKELQQKFAINDEFEQYLDEGGYTITNPWYIQCMNGALEAVKHHSKYNKDKKVMHEVENRWRHIFENACQLSRASEKYINVICHRDLWNNNILFHYKAVGDSYEPDDCVFVDFQAVRCQPPAGDVMLLLHCNLEPKYREENMKMFLEFYYEELKIVLDQNGIAIKDVLTKDEFLATAEEQRLWGLVVSASLLQIALVNDEITTKFFSDSEQFNRILSEDKASFINKMMQENEDYKNNLMQIFDEIVERYCKQK